MLGAPHSPILMNRIYFDICDDGKYKTRIKILFGSCHVYFHISSSGPGLTWVIGRDFYGRREAWQKSSLLKDRVERTIQKYIIYFQKGWIDINAEINFCSLVLHRDLPGAVLPLPELHPARLPVREAHLKQQQNIYLHIYVIQRLYSRFRYLYI